jgi:two-component system, chemotaxis family, sensor kinase CheA
MSEFEIDREALVATFLAEAEETLAHMEQVLVSVEAAPSDEALLHELFRDAHTLKGGSGIVGFDAVRDLAHELEDVLERLRNRTLAVSNAIVTLLLGSVDALRAALHAASGAAELPASAADYRARLAEATRRQEAASGSPGERLAPAHAPAAGAPAPPRTSARSLRVDVAKLDRMLDLCGEFAIARGRLTELLERRSASAEELLEAHREADRLWLDLQDLVMKARMVPIGPTFHQHVRTVRDLASAAGKQVRLVVEGADAEVDTAVVELVRDPLTHMVRNAVDHGIEAPSLRRERGKDPVGTVRLRAFHESGFVVLKVSDDGAGLDREKIAARASALGLLPEGSRPGTDDLARAIFEPGFTTSDVVTEVSGRGVGMDVVRRNVEALRGSVSLESEPGRGTEVTVRVPLTLAVIQGFKVRAAEETYILPLDAVVECLDLPAEETKAGAPAGVLRLRERPLPYLRLRHRFGLAAEPPRRENVVVVRHGAALAGIAVDALLGECSTVIKPLGAALPPVSGVSGSSVLGDGRVALILDVAALLRDALRGGTVARAA